ncbi:TonB-dependent receptor [Gluconacetobacter sp. Hr-1-5]|uniref:TonB-dependent receptor n=1 Tax=Gluconacetobacter sp. Hr-1-5 TaxID=3395370 RepID=UPI003B51B42D
MRSRYNALKVIAFLGTGLSSGVAMAATHSFNIPAGSASEAFDTYQRQSGISILATGADTRGIHLAPVSGMMTDQAALQALLRGSPLLVKAFNGRAAVVISAPQKAIPAKKTAEANDIETLFVTGHRSVQSNKRTSDVIVDSISYDPFENLGGTSSIASSLVLIPGVAGIVDADEARYVSVRGIAPDLNQTTVDGITMASVGQSGGGSRQVNLQDMPAEMINRTDVYKSFTAEQDGDALGAVIDMQPMSAFSHKGLYKYFDGYGIYSTYGGAAGHSGQAGYDRHWGEGAKGIISDTFGKNREFGFVLSSRYQVRVRNSTKDWQSLQYFDPQGHDASAPVEGGSVGPSAFHTGNFQNELTTVGGSGRLEWQPTGTGLHASVMGWSYVRWENSTMDDAQYYRKGNTGIRQDANGLDEIQINSLYLKRRQDQWRRQHNGILGDLDWTRGQSNFRIRAGETTETYDNDEPYIQARTYPQNIWASYTGSPTNGLYEATGGWNSFAKTAKYAASSITHLEQHAWEGIPTARADYTYNVGPHARGFGLATGFEWRQLTIWDDSNQQNYDTGGNMTSYLLNTGYVAWKNNISSPVLNVPFDFPWSSLKQSAANQALTAYDQRIWDYRYRENVTDGYLSLHYNLANTHFIAGVRVDNVDYTAWTPVTNYNSTAVTGTTRNRGGYINPLPSFDVVHHFPHSVTVHASYSQSIGRPTPGNIAAAETMSCTGDGSDSSASGGTQCSITKGNPNLKPRRAQNFDVSVDKYFNHNNGMVSAAFFSKWIKDDIYNLTTYQMYQGDLALIRQPMNASGSNIKGVEFNVMNRNMSLWGQVFDASANATWMQGSMTYSNGTTMLHTNHLIYQPDYLVNGALTWHIPAIRGALRATATYSGKYLTGLGNQPWQNTGFGSLFSLNLGFWHQVHDHITLKYEIMNLADQQPVWRTGSTLQYISEKDNYGRSFYFHVIIN